MCKEGDQLEIDISQRYGLRAIATASNLGIQEGLAACAEAASSEIVLIMENDCILSQPNFAIHTLKESEAALLSGEADVVKLGDLRSGLIPRYQKYWGEDMPPRKTLLGYVRSIEAKACIGNMIHHVNFPADGFPPVKRLSENVYVIPSEFVNWTNRAFMIKKSFFIDKIIKFARQNPARNNVNGKPDLEKEINYPKNRRWWRQQNFKVGIARPGLFGHERLDRNDDDEKENL